MPEPQYSVPQRAASNDRLNILLSTLGSAGDVHPMIALGLELRTRGHHATVITNPYFERQIKDAGLDFIGLGTIQDAEAIIADPRLWHSTKSFECIAEGMIVPGIEPLYRIIQERQTSNTVLVASSLCLGARVAQEKLGLPLATVHLQPAVLRSLYNGGRQGRFPMDSRVPRFVKRAIMWLVDKAFIDRILAPPLNSFRTSLGLPPTYRIFMHYIHSPQLVLGLFPEWFAPIQPDWPPHTHLTGFTMHDNSERTTVPPDVERFFAAGPPPLVFTPGSAAATLTEFFKESVEACRIGGFRAMLVTNFPEQLPANLPPGVQAFNYLPFSRILPRCSALVYHGGIGTMAQAIKAGIPHLIVPHGHDQPDNAFRIKGLGLGESIYPEKYKAADISRLLKQMLESGKYRARCAEYAGKIDSRAAVERACDLIEGLAPTKNVPTRWD